jgi:hypothetical protein
MFLTIQLLAVLNIATVRGEPCRELPPRRRPMMVERPDEVLAAWQS